MMAKLGRVSSNSSFKGAYAAGPGAMKRLTDRASRLALVHELTWRQARQAGMSQLTLNQMPAE